MDTDRQRAKFGPATVNCPYCLEEIEVSAGPTRRAKIEHCGQGWMIVDLVDEAAGRASAP